MLRQELNVAPTLRLSLSVPSESRGNGVESKMLRVILSEVEG